MAEKKLSNLKSENICKVYSDKENIKTIKIFEIGLIVETDNTNGNKTYEFLSNKLAKLNGF